MSEKRAKILQFRRDPPCQILSKPADPKKKPLASIIAGIYRDAHKDLGQGNVSRPEIDQAAGLIKALAKIESKAENLNIRTLSRYHSGEYEKEQAVVELVRLGLVLHISALLRKIMKGSMLSDPGAFRCAVLAGSDFVDLIKNRGFMPNRAAYRFPSDLDANLESIEGLHKSYKERLDAFANGYCPGYLDMEDIKQNAMALIEISCKQNP